MNLVSVLSEVSVVVLVLLVAASAGIIGLARIRAGIPELSSRVRQTGRPLLLLVAVLVVNSVVRDVGVGLSWLIGVNITGTIFAIEGTLVATIQSLTPQWLILYFSAIYVYGYVFLLVFPILATLMLPKPTYLRETAIAYTTNYAIGLVCYVLFVAYGPRNVTPELVKPLLFDSVPRFQLLTSEVNANTNVFPSLHTSLSVTVALLAARTREFYPRWLPVAAFLASNVVLSTMVLGIHWATDVVAGILLGVFSVRVATHPRFSDA